MTPRTAEEKLAARKKRTHGKPGPLALNFTLPEIAAVHCLAAHGHTSGTIATRSGLSIKQFRKARERDERLSDALIAGRAEERLKINGALLKTALDPKNPRQVQAAVSLLKARHGYVDGGKGGGVDVTVNNTLSIPAPLDERKYKRLITEAAKDTRPVLIEHDTSDDALGPRLPVDPVRAALGIPQKESDDD